MTINNDRSVYRPSTISCVVMVGKSDYPPLIRLITFVRRMLYYKIIMN